MNEFYLGIAAIGVVVLALGLISEVLNRSFLSAPMLAMLAGVALSPAALDWLNPVHWGLPPYTLLEEAVRLTMAIGLMGVALRLPAGFFARQWRSMLVLLAVGMPLMWLLSSVVVYWLLGLPLLLALLVGAVVTPTDPVVSTSIVTGSVAESNVPGATRHTISAESGANDGLAYPLVMLPVLLLTRPAGEAWQHWLTHTLLREIGGAVLLGLVLGIAAGGLLRLGERWHSIEKHSFLAYTVSLTLLALGSAKLIGTDGVLAVFVTGLAFDQVVGGSERAQEENVQEAVNQFFTLPAFVLFGLMLPWQEWRALGWTAVALVAAILLLRRLPMLLLLRPLIPTLRDPRDAAYAGWFGPIGLAALLYATMAASRTGEHLVWTAGSLIVFGSVLAHSMTAAPFARLRGRGRKQ